MFPLRKRYLIRGAKEHVAAGLGVGADYKTTGIWLGDYPSWAKKYLRAPYGGLATVVWGDEGGLWIKVKRRNGDIIEMAHNTKAYVKTGAHLKQGQRIGLTGNTGKITTGSHLHIQCFDKSGKRLDPVKYFAENP